MFRYFVFTAAWLGLALAAAPAVSQAQEVQYLTGGVGLSEREAMAAAEKDYNLKVEMATTAGFYIANAHVSVWDKTGDMVLEATADGPLMLANLAPGIYSVNIIYQDKEQKKTVTLDGASSKKLIFVWDSGDEW